MGKKKKKVCVCESSFIFLNFRVLKFKLLEQCSNITKPHFAEKKVMVYNVENHKEKESGILNERKEAKGRETSQGYLEKMYQGAFYIYSPPFWPTFLPDLSALALGLPSIQLRG